MATLPLVHQDNIIQQQLVMQMKMLWMFTNTLPLEISAVPALAWYHQFGADVSSLQNCITG